MAVSINREYVVDASFVLSFLFPDELQPEADRIFNLHKENLIKLVSTALLPFEVVNALNLALIRKRLGQEDVKERIKEFLNFQIKIIEVDFMEIFLLAEKYNLTVYDASYLYLAQQNNLPLLTLDKKLQKLI